jgi:hypothetical protein
MVAITVILAAVIGAFVLEIGDQQETAPSTSFDSEQQTEYFKTGNGAGSTANWTVVEVNHAGGQTINVNQLQATYKGNSSLWGWGHTDGNSNIPAHPTPNILPSLGSNDAVEVSSGQTMRFIGYEGWNIDNLQRCNYNMQIVGAGKGQPRPRLNAPGCSYSYNGNAAPILTHDPPQNEEWTKSGSAIRLVWTASSGGKTQTLFKYTVQ